MSESRQLMYASQICSRFRPFQKRKKGSSPAQRKGQTSVAATLMEEVLQQNFLFLLVYGTEDDDPGFTVFGTHPAERIYSTLRSCACVGMMLQRHSSTPIAKRVQLPA